MLQLLFAVAFSAVPLTLYVPPIRSFNHFVQTIEELFRHTALYTLRAYPRIRLGFSRIFNSLFHVSRFGRGHFNGWKLKTCNYLGRGP
ncbi:hypothetical protein Patl1_20561 [Pistacia atlantica]|uniref:Uncharacterized protein n=1 Tax=Pistacia atlantica TaxID=434234 RepID=A0ACC1BN92_9ROSI|nr:hypothetical protein Patl1_20561 [Pistacia atlantica]